MSARGSSFKVSNVDMGKLLSSFPAIAKSFSVPSTITAKQARKRSRLAPAEGIDRHTNFNLRTQRSSSIFFTPNSNPNPPAPSASLPLLSSSSWTGTTTIPYGGKGFERSPQYTEKKPYTSTAQTTKTLRIARPTPINAPLARLCRRLFTSKN